MVEQRRLSVARRKLLVRYLRWKIERHWRRHPYELPTVLEDR